MIFRNRLFVDFALLWQHHMHLSPFSLNPSPRSPCTSPFPHSSFVFCGPPRERQPTVWPWCEIIHWRMVAMDFLCNSIILIIQTTATYLLDNINCNFWNFLLLHIVSFEMLFHFLYFALLSVPSSRIYPRCPESSMDVTGPVHLSAPLCTNFWGPYLGI